MPADAVVIFGATGDLAMRMLSPSLFHLHADALLPGARVVGAARQGMDDVSFRHRVAEAVRGREPAADAVALDRFLARVSYAAVDATDADNDPTLFVRRDEAEAAWAWVDGVEEAWARTGQRPTPYPAGSWGPAGAFALTERNGHSWNG